MHWRSGVKADMNSGKGISAINLGYVTSDPFYARLLEYYEQASAYRTVWEFGE